MKFSRIPTDGTDATATAKVSRSGMRAHRPPPAWSDLALAIFGADGGLKFRDAVEVAQLRMEAMGEVVSREVARERLAEATRHLVAAGLLLEQGASQPMSSRVYRHGDAERGRRLHAQLSESKSPAELPQPVSRPQPRPPALYGKLHNDLVASLFVEHWRRTALAVAAQLPRFIADFSPTLRGRVDDVARLLEARGVTLSPGAQAYLQKLRRSKDASSLLLRKSRLRSAAQELADAGLVLLTHLSNREMRVELTENAPYAEGMPRGQLPEQEVVSLVREFRRSYWDAPVDQADLVLAEVAKIAQLCPRTGRHLADVLVVTPDLFATFYPEYFDEGVVAACDEDFLRSWRTRPSFSINDIGDWCDATFPSEAITYAYEHGYRAFRGTIALSVHEALRAPDLGELVFRR